jgi:hypothetical protein
MSALPQSDPRLIHLQRTQDANPDIPCWYVILPDPDADDFDCFSGFTPQEALGRAAKRLIARQAKEQRETIAEALKLEPLWVRALPTI